MKQINNIPVKYILTKRNPYNEQSTDCVFCYILENGQVYGQLYYTNIINKKRKSTNAVLWQDGWTEHPDVWLKFFQGAGYTLRK